MRPFVPKTKPFAHQQAEFETSRDLEARALWWEMGTGKSKTVIDTAADLHLRGRIGGMLVVAPNGVHVNWALDEIPAHMVDEVKVRVFLWETQRSKAQYFKRAFAEFMAAEDGLAVLVISYNSIMTKRCAQAARKFLESRPCLYVADETTKIAQPNSKVSIRVLASARYAAFRRVLNGTPVSDSPFQVYSQLRFADPMVWARSCGLSGYGDFKAYFGVWEHRKQPGSDDLYPTLIRHRNLDRMHVVMDQVGSRLLKDEVLDLPPKLYGKVYYDLSAAQRRVYDDLKRKFVAWFDDGASVTATMAIVRLTRLQQVCSGYVPVDDSGEPSRRIGDESPRIRALAELLGRVPRQAIVWAKYDIDVDLIAEAARAGGWSHVVYDGRTPPDERLRARTAFQAGDAKLFVSKPSCAGLGLTLTAADTVVYYNSSFSLSGRLQSEARPHRIGQTRPVHYVDILGRDTVDEYILDNLRRKISLAALVTGDQIPEWA